MLVAELLTRSVSDKNAHISLQFPEYVVLQRSDGLTAVVEPYLKGSG